MTYVKVDDTGTKPVIKFRRIIMATQVTKDTKIGELLGISADVAPVLFSIGMHCLGCPASQMETIEEAAAVHGVDADELVNALNKKIEEANA